MDRGFDHFSYLVAIFADLVKSLLDRKSGHISYPFFQKWGL